MLGTISFWDPAHWVTTNPQAPKKLLDQHKLTLKNFGGTDLVIIDPNHTNPGANDTEINFHTFENLPQAIQTFPQSIFIFLEPKNSIPPHLNPTPLHKFSHPTQDVFYVTGSNFGTIPFALLEKQQLLDNNHIVYIDTPSSTPLYDHVALGLALYDRHAKQGLMPSLS